MLPHRLEATLDAFADVQIAVYQKPGGRADHSAFNARSMVAMASTSPS